MSDTWELPMTGADGAENELILHVAVNDFDDKLYIATASGTYEFDRLFERWYPSTEIPQLEVTARHIRQPSDLLPSAGLNFVDEGALTDLHNRSFRLTDIVDDGRGDLWIGSDGLGAFTAGSSARIMQEMPYGLIQEDVSAVCLDGDDLWLGGRTANSYRTGVTRFNLEENSFAYLESGVEVAFPSRDVYALAVSDNTVYCGTDDGLYITDANSTTYVQHFGERQGLPDDMVLSLVAAGDSLFVGTSGGLCFMSMAQDSLYLVKPDQFGGRIIYDLEIIGSHLWIASDAGAYRLSLEDGRLQRFNDPKSILFGGVYDIEPYETDIWFASDAGLLRLDTETGQTEPFRNQMRVDYKRSMAVNGSVAVAASNNGLTLFYYTSPKKLQREFTDNDGLASNEVRTLLLDGDFIWIGTDKGLTRFWWSNPDRID